MLIALLPSYTPDVAFELWDGELGLSLGSYATEGEALAAVRSLCSQIGGSRAPLGLIADRRHVVATGEALVERAFDTCAQS